MPSALLASSLATWAIHRAQPGYSSLGASGAILAVVFAAIVVNLASLLILPIPFPIPALLFAVGYLAYSVLAGAQRWGASTTMRMRRARWPGWCSWRSPCRACSAARCPPLQLSVMPLPLPDRFESPRPLVRPVEERDRRRCWRSTAMRRR